MAKSCPKTENLMRMMFSSPNELRQVNEPERERPADDDDDGDDGELAHGCLLCCFVSAPVQLHSTMPGARGNPFLDFLGAEKSLARPAQHRTLEVTGAETTRGRRLPIAMRTIDISSENLEDLRFDTVSKLRQFRTRRGASEAAKSLGWSSSDVLRVYGKFSGYFWVVADGHLNAIARED